MEVKLFKKSRRIFQEKNMRFNTTSTNTTMILHTVIELLQIRREDMFDNLRTNRNVSKCLISCKIEL